MKKHNPKSKESILIVDDEAISLKNIVRILEKQGYQTTATTDGKKAMLLLKNRSFDLVLTDLIMGSVDGIDILTQARSYDPETEVVIITGHGSIDSAIEATQKGAFHYLQKPIKPDEVRHIVAKAIEKRRLVTRIHELEHQGETDFPNIIGNSPQMISIKKLIRQISDSNSNVLITGQSGTGKEVIAKAIHYSSPRKDKRFLAFNCAAFSEDLLANELFGHEKDAYTGATQARAGLLESADQGTVFFDEVGDMSLAMQAKLLRVIQERELIRVGGVNPIPIDIRIIAATNKDLKKLSNTPAFRQDLFFRLNVIPLNIPTLSERKEDIPMFASYFLKKYCKQMGKELSGFSDEVLGLLSSYGYPGNVRELENIIEHATSMAQGQQIELRDLPADLKDYDSYTFHRQSNELKTLEQLEWEYIHWVLDRVNHKKTKAAQILGIDRASLYRKLKRFTFKK